jgi:hypothetical protein
MNIVKWFKDKFFTQKVPVKYEQPIPYKPNVKISPKPALITYEKTHYTNAQWQKLKRARQKAKHDRLVNAGV